MSVYKLELEKASIIIKKETIINPPPVIETVDIPDGVTFGYSDFSDPEALKKVIPYVNNGNYGAHLFLYCKFPTVIDRSIKFRIASGSWSFSILGTIENPVDCINIDCERITSLYNTLSAYITEVHFYNTENIETINGLLGSGNYDYVYGLDLRNCYEFTSIGSGDISLDFIEILNLGMHKDLVYINLKNLMALFSNQKAFVANIVVENSFNRAEAGFEPCTVKLYSSSTLTNAQIAKATSKGYTITS